MTLADAYSPFSKIFNVRDVITFATTSSLISLVISYDRFFSFSFFFFSRNGVAKCVSIRSQIDGPR